MAPCQNMPPWSRGCRLLSFAELMGVFCLLVCTKRFPLHMSQWFHQRLINRINRNIFTGLFHRLEAIRKNICELMSFPWKVVIHRRLVHMDAKRASGCGMDHQTIMMWAIGTHDPMMVFFSRNSNSVCPGSGP